MRARTLERKNAPTGDDDSTSPAEIKTVLEGINKAVDEGLKAIGRRVAALEDYNRRPNNDTRPTDGNEEAKQREAKAFEAFVRRGRESMAADEVKSLMISEDTAGGYLAPGQFVAELLRNVTLFSPIRRLANVKRTGSGVVILPRRTGGMTASWVPETGARPETTVTFGSSRYPVCELAAYVDVSNSILEDDGFDIAGLLAEEFGLEFGRAEAAGFTNGAATALEPSGLMNDASIAYTASGHASQINTDCLIDAFHALPEPYRVNATWLANSTTLATLRKLKDGNGNYLMLMAGVAGQVNTTLLGRPVVEAPDLSDVGAGNYPVVIGDFNQGYRIFDRIELAVLRDPYSQATNGMTRFHGRRRVAGGVGKAEAVRKIKIAAS